VPLLQNPNEHWEDRQLFTHVGRWPKGADINDYKYANCSVRTSRWHLVSADKMRKQWQLFDVKTDAGETTDLAAVHPEVVKQLDAAYDEWWQSLPPHLANEHAIGPKTNPFADLYWKQFGGAPMPVEKKAAVRSSSGL
jgi:arylsulfatase